MHLRSRTPYSSVCATNRARDWIEGLCDLATDHLLVAHSIPHAHVIEWYRNSGIALVGPNFGDNLAWSRTIESPLGCPRARSISPFLAAGFVLLAIGKIGVGPIIIVTLLQNKFE